MAFMDNNDMQDNFDNIIDKMEYLTAKCDNVEIVMENIRDSIREIIGLMSGGDK